VKGFAAENEKTTGYNALSHRCLLVRLRWLAPLECCKHLGGAFYLLGFLGFGPRFCVFLNFRNFITSMRVNRQSVRPSNGIAIEGLILPPASQRFNVTR
jgi:hypothetical protein